MSFHIGPKGQKGSGHMGMGQRPVRGEVCMGERTPVVPFYTNVYCLENKMLLLGPIHEVLKHWVNE